MLAVIAAHLCAAILAPALVSAWGRRALAILASAPASALAYALARTGDALGGASAVESLTWIDGLDLTIRMRMDALSWVMTLIVGGVGALVLVYASRYFTDSSHGLRRFAAVFTAFAGAMLGIVQVDHTIGLYIFWEATSILSFLLIGHHFDRRPARIAARQALLVTTSGALAMFSGFVILAHVPAGSYRLSDLAAGGLDPSDPRVLVGALLVLAGAFSKSALVPSHFWLPGAMAAPTPVSAYLHAAAMVKAGVYLVARLTPGLAAIPAWSPVVVAVGTATMLLGGWRALKQHDLKLVLAYGTVSQLGLITAAVGHGSAGAMAAGLTMLIAHSFFKSTLFLTVGAIESATGTRDWRRLSGLGRRRPVLAAAAGLAAASMAGLPPTTGYLGKEAMIAALVDASGAPWAGRGADAVLLVLLVAGSILTAAYSWRAWWGAFGVRDVADEDRVSSCRATPWPMQAVIVVLSLGAAIGLAPGPLETILAPAWATMPGHAHLAWWSGPLPALVTAAILAVAAALAAAAPRVEDLQRATTLPIAAVDLYAWSLRELELLAARMTRLTQRGSLPWDLSVIFTVLVVLTAGSLIASRPASPDLTWADSPIQLLIGLVVLVAAVETVRSRRRLRAVVALGGVGLGVAALYASQGAPDLALTQVVVEAVSVIVFVLVLRRLPRFFSDRPLASSRWLKLALAVAVGLGVVVAGLVASSARVHDPVSSIMPNEALAFGEGENIVNVILVDIRAWDTVGELSVLLVIATGVASLIYVRSRSGPIDKAPLSPGGHRAGEPTPSTPGEPGERGLVRRARRASFLNGALALPAQERSVVLEVAAHLLFPTMIVVSIWLLLIGHNNPGGGFAGGVVAGLAFVVRYLAGGRHELGEAMPIPPGRILGLGLFTVGAAALAPLALSNSVLQSTPVDLDLGPLGHLHFTTAMVLDVGVYILVVGLVLDLISATGAQIDRQSARPDHEANARGALR
ncbi:Na+/H+ antiporter subunit A [Actinomyces sp. B33]|uniref:Na+/H+ antiporter subunit A n=1 Tax=Actinomyces sp. B33 TaxID=2942131 RepID=UPI00234172E4|nr:Na+/H+ antiporter subunit A [Actinomyces sp. B33]MDC4233465.1 Na+/H+ antiporter subunit A [Actinomyces sp. B33]